VKGTTTLGSAVIIEARSYRKAMSAVTSKLKKKHIRVKHQKVKVFRAKEPLLSVFMWGVNHTVSGSGT
jgi:hypothetical protein